jgi:hypothetical protein
MSARLRGADGSLSASLHVPQVIATMTLRPLALALLLVLACARLSAQDVDIVLLAGAMLPVDRPGHHDYQGGIQVLRDCLQQTPGVRVTMSTSGWPADEQDLASARTVVFYCDGGGRQPYLASPARIAAIDALVARGAGLVVIHQAIDHPAEHVERAMRWLGGSYDPAVSQRGHWPTTHADFPVHALTSGVTPWTITDGWLCGLRFVPGRQGIVPCVWSSKGAQGSSAAGDSAIAAWGYERPTGGRSFTFTGLDAHDAWKRPGVRQLVSNGVLWSAGMAIPQGGAPCALDDAAIDHHLTPRFDGSRLFNK